MRDLLLLRSLVLASSSLHQPWHVVLLPYSTSRIKAFICISRYAHAVFWSANVPMFDFESVVKIGQSVRYERVSSYDSQVFVYNAHKHGHYRVAIKSPMILSPPGAILGILPWREPRQFEVKAISIFPVSGLPSWEDLSSCIQLSHCASKGSHLSSWCVQHQ